ncbi:MAG TPA: hypothetical protein VFH48_29835 [Chloroflexota bacterium]|nr:hypothetical protein [Chloroflexota bacterium]
MGRPVREVPAARGWCPSDGGSYHEAGAVRGVGIGERTVYRRLEAQRFRRRIEQARAELVAVAACRHPDQRARIERGALRVALRCIVPDPRHDGVLVESEAEPNAFQAVGLNAGVCGRRDFQLRGIAYKHLWAVKLLRPIVIRGGVPSPRPRRGRHGHRDPLPDPSPAETSGAGPHPARYGLRTPAPLRADLALAPADRRWFAAMAEGSLPR